MLLLSADLASRFTQWLSDDLLFEGVPNTGRAPCLWRHLSSSDSIDLASLRLQPQIDRTRRFVDAGKWLAIAIEGTR